MWQFLKNANPLFPIPYNNALLLIQVSALNRFLVSNSWLLMPSGKQVEQWSMRLIFPSTCLSQSLRSLVRKERAISWPKRTLNRFKWLIDWWDRSDENCGKALRRGAPPRVQIPYSRVAEEGDASVQVVWALQNVLCSPSPSSCEGVGRRWASLLPSCGSSSRWRTSQRSPAAPATTKSGLWMMPRRTKSALQDFWLTIWTSRLHQPWWGYNLFWFCNEQVKTLIISTCHQLNTKTTHWYHTSLRASKDQLIVSGWFYP